MTYQSVKSNTVYGIYVILIGLLLMSVYSIYWITITALHKVYGITTPPSVVDVAMYVVFWTGAVLFAIGVAMVVAGVYLDAVLLKVQYKHLKRQTY